eukprot:IDg5235t1
MGGWQPIIRSQKYSFVQRYLLRRNAYLAIGQCSSNVAREETLVAGSTASTSKYAHEEVSIKLHTFNVRVYLIVRAA